jgi:26S proteasome regulatory subunit T5
MTRSRTTWKRLTITGRFSLTRGYQGDRADGWAFRQLPYLVGNVVEILDLDVTAEAVEEGANIDLDATRVGKSAVIKTSTRQTIFLPLIGLVDHEKLKPGDLIGVNKDSYLILDTLPAEYDSRVKAMEVDEKPTEKYTDVGGLDKQIEELVEAVVWPMKEAERFKKIGIKAPKGISTIMMMQITC